MKQTPRDYDDHPDRYRAGMRQAADLGVSGTSVYDAVAQYLDRLGATLLLDIGCGDGVLRRSVAQSSRVVSMDRSLTLLRRVPALAVGGDALALPFHDGVFDAAVSVNVLDHLAEPAAALREARRVLRPLGVFLAGAISRHDSPELADVWRPTPTPFDSEDAPHLVAGVFEDVQVHEWDAPLLTLPDRDAVRGYLEVRFVPGEAAAEAAGRVATPITLTKRGALVVGRRAR